MNQNTMKRRIFYLEDVALLSGIIFFGILFSDGLKTFAHKEYINVFALLIGITPFVALIGFAAGAIGLMTLRRKNRKFTAFFKSLIGILPGVYLTMPMVMASIIIIYANSKPTQSEAKQNLGAIFTAYTSYYSDYNTFPAAPFIKKDGVTYNCLNIADWEPRRKIRFSYKCAGQVVYSPSKGGVDCDVFTGADQQSFTVAACANIDNDSTIDVWTIDTGKRIRNVVDDVKN